MRVLGCLVEKEATTPDVYPLSTNALVAACNQKTSRHPIVRFDDKTVDATMLALRERGFARTVRGAGHRTPKHRHVLDEALGLSGQELALFSVLMLRGEQTTGELRQRTERYCEFASLEAVEGTLADLTTHSQRLAIKLEREAGQKEPRWKHRVGGVPSAPAPATPAAAPVPADTPSSDAATPTATVPNSADDLEGEVAALRDQLATLTHRFDALCESLGESFD